MRRASLIVGIHQPNYLPWIGYFHKIARSDRFILLDDVQYTKNGFTNRNRIKTPAGPAWLTVPMHTKGRWPLRICDLAVDRAAPWVSKHRNSLQANYGRAPYFCEVMERVIDPVLAPGGPQWDSLAALNRAFIQRICDCLDIRTPLAASSQYASGSASTERLIELVRAVGGTVYLSGRGGQRYQDASQFRTAGIELVYTDFQHPSYEQLWGQFEPNLSALDLLFCRGPGAAELFREPSLPQAVGWATGPAVMKELASCRID